MTTGVIIGKFLPPHTGHLFFIEESAKEVDKLFVIVDEHPIRDRKLCKDQDFHYINLDERYSLLKGNISNEKVIILKMSEEGLPEYPNGWLEWSKKVLDTIECTPDKIFTSDIDYIKEFKKYFPNTLPVIIDEKRITFPISATKVRKNWKKHTSHLPKNVIEFLRRKYER